MNNKHHHHSHKPTHKEAKEHAETTKERLEERTLHAHEKAMPHGEGISPPHDEHVGMVSGQVVGYITLRDQIRPESAEAIRVLRENGIRNLLITGDNERIAKSVSDALGMDGYFANVLPHEKQEKAKELQAQGEFVAMTGDGVNDAPALAQANVGIAVGSGTDVAAETADIILVNSNPQDIASLILFGKATYRKMIQNLIWATGYNVVALPLAAGVLYSQGVMISPAVGAAFMSLSTIIVAINAQLLKKNIKSKV